MKGKRVFISGGAGVIGSALVELLIQAEAIVFVGDLKPCPQSWKGIVKYRQGDLNYISSEELLQFAPEIFFHLAATFERSEESYAFFDENFMHNIRLSHHLINCLKDCASLNRVIFASSYLIYDPKLYTFSTPQSIPTSLKETSSIYPRNICGAAKLFHELELRFLSVFSTITFASTRIFRVYGRNSKDIISRWIRQAIKGEVLSVYHQEGIFDYIFADDVAKGLLNLSKTEFEGILNLGSGKGRKVSAILDILKIHFPDLQTQLLPANLPYESSEADMNEWKEQINWLPENSLETAIPLLINFENQSSEVSLEENSGVLITSISRKIPLLEAVKKAAQKLGKFSQIYGCDQNAGALGQYAVDTFWHCLEEHRLTIDQIVDYCHQHKITAIIPTRDGELAFFAANRVLLEKKGIHVMISSFETTQNCIDKWLFAEILHKHHFHAIQTELQLKKVNARRYVVKERFGAGSKNIGLNLSAEEAVEFAESLKEPIFQPFIEGIEYSVDLYRDKEGIVKGVIARKRNCVVNGESQITTTVSFPELELLCAKIADCLNLYGHAVFQVIESKSKVLHVIECNPRFGGASTASIAAGLDSFYWFLLECLQQNLKDYDFCRIQGEIRQIRFPSDQIIPWK